MTEQANRQAIEAMSAVRPRLVDILPAGEAIPGMERGLVLHAGPPVAWEQMVEVQRGAVIGAVLFEGWALSPVEANARVASGEIRVAPCHEFNAVGGLAGVTSPSIPVALVGDAAGKGRAYARLWEPRLLFGRHDAETLEGLRWLRDVFAPTLGEAVRRAGGVDLLPWIGSALHMGDDCHSRLAASAAQFLRSLLPYLLRSEAPTTHVNATIEFMAANDPVYLPFIIGACKLMALAAENIPGSTVITAICSNGHEMGIRLSGTGARWFAGPAPVVQGNLLPGFSDADASPQIGDSAIAEVAGLGGCALAAAPDASSNTTGTRAGAVAFSEQALALAFARSSAWTIPALDFGGTALGLDASKMVETGNLVPLAAMIPGRRIGVGRVGSGIARPPLETLRAAVTAVRDVA